MYFIISFYIFNKIFNIKSIFNRQIIKNKKSSSKIIYLNSLKEVELDNKINISLYQKNIDFSNYSSNIKVIALYLPTFINKKYNTYNQTNEWGNIIKSKPLYKSHHQPRKPGDEKIYLGYYDLSNPEVIKKQVKLAKSHGIYGFGIYYYWNNYKILYEKPLNIYLENKDINFPFFLIWRNDYMNLKRKLGFSKREKINLNEGGKFIKQIKKYMIDSRYIKINNKSLLGIFKNNKIKKYTTDI